MGQEKAREVVRIPSGYKVRAGKPSGSSSHNIRLALFDRETFYLSVPHANYSGIKVLKRVRKRHNTGLV